MRELYSLFESETERERDILFIIWKERDRILFIFLSQRGRERILFILWKQRDRDRERQNHIYYFKTKRQSERILQQNEI